MASTRLPYCPGMLDALLPLLGVVLGGFISFAVNAYGERRRFLERWDTARFNQYVEYVSAVKASFRHARAVAEGRGSAAESSSDLSLMESEEHRRSIAFETLMMLGGPAVREAGHAVNRELWALHAIARAERPQDDFPEAPLFERIDDFHAAVRDELAVQARTTRHP